MCIRDRMSKALDGRVQERAQHHDVDPSLDVMSNIEEALAGIEAAMRLVDEYRCAAEACHPGLETETRAERRLLEKQDLLFADERSQKIVGMTLHQQRQLLSLIHISEPTRLL